MALNTQYSKMTQKRSSIPGVVPRMGLTQDHTDGTWDGVSIYSGELFYNMADNLLWIGNPNGPQLINMSNIDIEVIQANFDNIEMLIEEVNNDIILMQGDINNLDSDIINLNNTVNNNFMTYLMNYNQLMDFFMKCCNQINDRLIKIEKRLDNMVVVKTVYIKVPCPIKKNDYLQKQPKPVYVAPVQPIIEEYVIDQTLQRGYVEGWTNDTNWLISGSIRRLSPRQIPYKKGSSEANLMIERIKGVYGEFSITLNEKDLQFKVREVNTRHWNYREGDHFVGDLLVDKKGRPVFAR